MHVYIIIHIINDSTQKLSRNRNIEYKWNTRWNKQKLGIKTIGENFFLKSTKKYDRKKTNF